ncbi:MAG TPA: ABC transporter permease [Opitutaceae bacterium]|jgi:predicted permease|nr:ABC transporter permease [Opitutaceae bacterium]
MNDLKYALRALLKSPVYAAIAVVTLALGIGLNTAMFSLMNTMFLQPLPFQDSSSLDRVFRVTPGNDSGDLSSGDFIDLRAAETGVAEFAALRDQTDTLSEVGLTTELERSLEVSDNFFDVLKLRPEIGRSFTPKDGAAGSPGVVVISNALWRSRYNSSPDVLGREVRLGSQPYSIVGVLPEWAVDGRLLRGTSLVRPMRLSSVERTSRSDPWMRVIGRRAPGVKREAAAALVAAVGQRMAHENPKDDATASWATHDLAGGTGNQSGRIVVALLIGLSTCVLLIACSNLANFVLARAIERSQELSVRSALGASLFHLIRPLALESLILSVAGGFCALIVNFWCTGWVSAQAIASGDSAIHFSVDWKVLSVAGLSAAMTAIVFGTAPALLIARINVQRTLKSGMRGATSGTAHTRMRNILVVGQFAMAMTLLVGATYLVRGADHLLSQNLGWNSSDVALGELNLPKAKYDSPEKILAFQRELRLRLGRIAGSDSVAVAYSFPYGGGMGQRKYQVDGKEAPAKGAGSSAGYNGISPDYFKVIGGRIIAGRDFTDADGAASPRVAIISEALARVLFPDGDAVGRRIRDSDGGNAPWLQVVGIAADLRFANFYENPVEYQVYHPIAQEPWQYFEFAVRSSPAALKSVVAGLRPAVSAIDPDLAVEGVMTGERRVELTYFDLGMLKHMLAAFALLGLFLAALGIYGAIARMVANRTPEIGIRMALGATTGNVRKLILTSGLRLALTGAIIGLLGSIGITKVLGSIMRGLPSNLVPIAADSAIILAVVAVIASYVPARAASRINPLDAIRGE